VTAALSVRGLRVILRGPAGALPAVRGIDFDLGEAEVLGLVGESGCGKSMTALALMGLLPPRAASVEAGRLWLRGVDLRSRPARRARAPDGHRLAMIFQDPATALDPVFRVGGQIAAAVRRTRGASAGEAHRVALDALEKVGFDDAETTARAYPHQLSGGMRQLVMIAMAMAVQPAVLLADEPTTALDVTTQSIVLQHLLEMPERFGTSILLISHDLGVVAQAAGRCLIMYRGLVMEEADSTGLFARPRHPYTARLLAAIPTLQKRRNLSEMVIPGQVPAADAALAGCAFAPRCEFARGLCMATRPEPPLPGQAGVACHFPL